MRVSPLLWLAACGPAVPHEPGDCADPTALDGDWIIDGAELQAALDAFCLDYRAVAGDVILRGTSVKQLALDCVCAIDGDLVVDANLALERVGWTVPAADDPVIGGDLRVTANPSLVTILGGADVGGDVTIAGSSALAQVDLGEVAGDLRWTGPGLDLKLDVAEVGGTVALTGRANVQILSLDGIAGGLALSGQDGGTVGAPSLVDLGGDLEITGATDLVVDVSGLDHLSGSLVVEDSANVTLVPPTSETWSLGGDLRFEGVTGIGDLALPVDEVAGSVVFASVPDLATFAAPLATVGGDLVVEDAPLLVAIATAGTVVAGAVRLRDAGGGAPIDVGPLVGAVGGDLELTRSVVRNTSLCRVSAIGGSLLVTEAPFCTDYDSTVASVGGDLVFVDAAQGFLGALTSIGGDAILDGATDLSVTWPLLATIGGELVVRDTPALVWVAAPTLHSVSAVQVIANDVLVGVPEIPQVAQLDTAWIENNPSLVTLSGLAGLQAVGELHLERNDPLVTLDGLEQLSTADVVWLERNDALLELDALHSLTSVGTFGAVENGALGSAEIAALLAAIPEVGTVYLLGNGP